MSRIGGKGRAQERLPAWLGTAMALLVGAATAAPPLDHPPFPGAARIITVGPGDSTGAAGTVGAVMQPWLSDHEVLHFRHGLLYRYDATAKTDTVLTQLTRQVRSSHCYLYFLDASPDGRQVIWGMSANNPLFVADVDGTRRAQWDSGGGMSEPHWCADGAHWLQFRFGGTPGGLRWTGVQRHSLDAPHVSATLASLPPGLDGLDILAAPSTDEIVARTLDTVKIGPSKPTHVTEHPDGTSTYTFVETPALRDVQTVSVWSLRQPQPLHRWQIALPGKAMEVAVSPDGRRAAWLLVGQASQALWVSGVDGGRMHRIDVVRGRRGVLDSRAGNVMSQLQWVPGDRAVSFVYAGGLWTVPVD